MKSDTATLTCPQCHGSGHVPLPNHLAELLPIVKKIPDATIEKIHEAHPRKDEVTEGAIANRMADLLTLGLVERRRVSRWFHYNLSHPKTTK